MGDQLAETLFNNFSSHFQQGQSSHSPTSDISSAIASSVHAQSDKCFKITMEDIIVHINKVNKRAPPGPDGLTMKIIKKLDYLFLPIFLDLFNCWLTSVNPPSLDTQSYFIFFDKRKHKDTLKRPSVFNHPGLEDLRPINIEDCDSKIFASILNDAISPIITKVVHPNQFCCKGRNIHMPLFLLEDIFLAHKNQKKAKAFAIFLDIAKAFDNVDHPFLAQQIDKCITDPNLARGIKNYISNKSAFIKHGGSLFGPFRIRRGITQGSPLSSSLFALFLNPLLLELEANLPGLYSRGYGHPTVLLAYADDLVILCGDREEVDIALEIVDAFCEVAGARINKNKSVILSLADLAVVPGLGSVPPISYLGIPYPFFGGFARRKIEDKLLVEIESLLSPLKFTFLSIPLKIKILNCYCTSKIIYYACHFKFTKQFIARINSQYSKFIWKGKIHLINRKAMYPHTKKGGLGLIDLDLFLEMLRANSFRFIIDYCSSNNFTITFAPTDTPPPTPRLKITRLWRQFSHFRDFCDDYPISITNQKMNYKLIRDFRYTANQDNLLSAASPTWLHQSIEAFLPPNIVDFITKLSFKSLPINNLLIEKFKMNIDPSCIFCTQIESIDHLFLWCDFFKNARIWLDRITLCGIHEVPSLGFLVDTLISNKHVLRFTSVYLFACWKLRCLRIFQDLRMDPIPFIKMELKKLFIADSTYLKFDLVNSFWDTWPLSASDIGLLPV